MLKKCYCRKLRGQEITSIISKKVMKVDSRVVLIMSNGLFFN